MISRFALVAAASVLLGSAVTPAAAADLGGGCCADLEERVAELEATVARKGNRVVTLQIYGDVTKGLMYFDNGDDFGRLRRRQRRSRFDRRLHRRSDDEAGLEGRL